MSESNALTNTGQCHIYITAAQCPEPFLSRAFGIKAEQRESSVSRLEPPQRISCAIPLKGGSGS